MMEFNEFKDLTEILMSVELGRDVKYLKKVRNNPNKLKGAFINDSGVEYGLFVKYFPENGYIRISTDIPYFTDYTLAVQTVKYLKECKKNNVTYEDLQKPIMTKKELAKKFKAGKMKFELHGHFAGFSKTNKPAEKHLKDKFLDQYKHNYDGSIGKFDGTWNRNKKKSIETTNKDMREFYALDVNRSLQHGSRIMDRSIDSNCSCCGRDFDIVLKDADTISIAPGYRMKEQGDFNIECEFPNGPTPTSGKIKVRSKLVFANFFSSLKADAPKDKQYSDEFSVSKFSGRRNMTKWKSENQNVAYGQMGNMGLTIWVNKDKTHIILTESYMESEKKEKTLTDMEMHQVGKLSLSVWRWEATDVQTLETAAKKDIISIKKMMDKENKDIVIVPVKSGTWKFDHYYDTTPDPKDDDTLFIYAELKLIK